MTKLYYTDLLKSAFMAREFDVKFIDIDKIYVDDFTGRYWQIEAYKPYGADKVNLEMKPDKDFKLYIHPESLDIFKPQEGDMVRSVYKLNTTSEIGYDVGFLYDFFDSGLDIVRSTLSADCLGYDGDLDSIDKIIQRNNKHFFMPEEEV